MRAMGLRPPPHCRLLSGAHTGQRVLWGAKHQLLSKPLISLHLTFLAILKTQKRQILQRKPGDGKDPASHQVTSEQRPDWCRGQT